MVNLDKKGFALILKSARTFFKNEETSEEAQSTEGPEPTTPNPEAEPMPGFWESDLKRIGNNYQGDVVWSLESVPETTEGIVKESQYKYEKEYMLINKIRNAYLHGAPEAPKIGSGISTSGRDAGVVAGIVIAVISGIIILAALIAVVMYKHYVHRNVTSMNFDNPVYRKTTEDQFALEKNGYAPGSKLYPSTVGEEAQEPLNTPGTNDFV